MSFGNRLDRMFIITVFQILLTDKFSQMCQIHNSVQFYLMFSNNSSKIPPKSYLIGPRKYFRVNYLFLCIFLGTWNWKDKLTPSIPVSTFSILWKNFISHFFPNIFEQLLENTRTRTITLFTDTLQHSEVQMTFTHSGKFGT